MGSKSLFSDHERTWENCLQQQQLFTRGSRSPHAWCADEECFRKLNQTKKFGLIDQALSQHLLRLLEGGSKLTHLVVVNRLVNPVIQESVNKTLLPILQLKVALLGSSHRVFLRLPLLMPSILNDPREELLVVVVQLQRAEKDGELIMESFLPYPQRRSA